MHHKLDKARSLAKLIRFSGDLLQDISFQSGDHLLAFRDNSFKNGLEISELTTPYLWLALQETLATLEVPYDAVSAFVYSSPEIQAECYSGGGDLCVIRFSSALIELLDSDEFKFVIGHELAHFLLNHGGKSSKSLGLEFFSSRRAQEISADRLGLVACGSIDVAVRSLMKIMSGLQSKHLRFDVSKYISQLKNLTKVKNNEDGFNTHPSMAVRCRALLWFSLSRGFGKNTGYDDPLQKIDSRIVKELNFDGDRYLNDLVVEAKKELHLWMLVNVIASKGKFSKNMQKVIELDFGQATLEKLKNLLSSFEPGELLAEITSRVECCEENLRYIAPAKCDSIVEDLKYEISKQLSKFEESA